MKIVKYISAILLLFALNSCDKFMDVTPKGKVIPKTTADFDGMVKDPAHCSAAYPLVDISSDLFEMPASSLNGATNTSTGKAHLWMPTFYKDEEDDSGWNNAYKVIYTMNVVIANVMESKEGSDADKKRVMAEAKIQRAFYHWILVSTYGAAYDKATADKDLGIPIMLKPDLEAKEARSTVKKCFEAILEDLEVDPAWLPTSGEPGNLYRITRQSLHALRARVHLSMGNFDQAASEATLALAINNRLEDHNTYEFINPALPTSGVRNRSVYINSPEVLMFRSNGFPTLITTFNISPKLEALYGPDDLRLKFGFSNIARNGKPTDDGKKRATQELGGSIGVPEMMLIKAEALARKGDASALTLVNDLRKKRIATAKYTPLTASGKEALLKIVLEERERELAFFGMRWFDMKRLSKEGLFTTTLTRGNSTVTRTLEPNSPLYAFPIPPKVLLYNPNMVQNTRL